MSLAYLAYDLASRAFWENLTPLLSDVTFDDPVGVDEYGTLAAVLHPGASAAGDRVVSHLVKDRTWIIVVDSETRRIVWDGVLRARPYARRTESYALAAYQLRWWLHQRLTGTGDTERAWKAADRLVIARDLVKETGGGMGGDPLIVYGAETSGQQMDYQVAARSFASIGSHLAQLARGTGGFEWDLAAEWDDDGLPVLRLVLAHPEITAPALTLTYSDASGQGSIIGVPDVWPDSFEGSYARIWASGGGAGSVQPVGSDTDPATSRDPARPTEPGTWGRLLTEKTSTYPDVTDATELVDRAREERLTLSYAAAPVTVTAAADRPALASYGKGSRARLMIDDGPVQLDEPGVRVINVRYRQATPGQAFDRAEITLDLSDTGRGAA